MTTPAFRQLIAINTPNAIERNLQMTATTLGVDYRRNELQQVANDLRNERTLTTARTSGHAGRVRFAIGLALVDLGTALAGSSRRTSIPAR
jgi:predicted polyphosphate/ATP-dependent NAD kinase